MHTIHMHDYIDAVLHASFFPIDSLPSRLMITLMIIQRTPVMRITMLIVCQL